MWSDSSQRIFAGAAQVVNTGNGDLFTLAIPTDTIVSVVTLYLGKQVGGSNFGSVRGNTRTYRNVGGTVTEVAGGGNYFNNDDGVGSTSTPVISGTNVIFRITGTLSITVDWISEHRVMMFPV